jgi:signal transduction histidine kinase
MFRISRDGVYLDYHSGAGQLFVPPERFLGKTVDDVMPPNLAAKFKRSFADAARSGGPVSLAYSLPMADGERYYEARLVSLEGGDVLSIVRDVTESRRAVDELERNQLALAASHRQVKELAGRLIVAQEGERRHIARELHDDIGQRVGLIAMELQRLRLSAMSKEMAAQLDQLSGLAGEIASALHRVAYRLHPAKLEAIGLAPSIDSLCRELSSQSAIEIVFSHRNLPATVEPDVALCLFRIVQEALHNVVKHSLARHAAVELSQFRDRLELRIADSGVGFVEGDSKITGLGLISMRERVHYLGGRMVIHTAPRLGTRIGVSIPVPFLRTEST